MKTHRNARQRIFCQLLVLICIFIHASAFTLHGQVRSDSLPEVQVVSTRYKVPAIEQPQQVMMLGSELLGNTSARDLVSLLSLYGHAYLRSYGPGLAAGLTQRGFGTTSFQVIRDGFTLNQPMHGQVDMALFPVATLGYAEIATANTSTTYGSAASGGSLLLGGDWRHGWSASHERGPWGYQESFGSVVGGVGSATVSFNAGITTSDNNFEYKGIEPESVLRRDNNSLDKRWLQLGYLMSGNTLNVRTNVYAHKADRGIPDPINFAGTLGSQQDEEVRITSDVSGPGSDSKWSASAQLWQSRLLYDDSWLTETSYNRVRGASLAFSYSHDPAPWFNLSSMVGAEAIAVTTNNYGSPQSRNSGQAGLRGIVRLPFRTLLFPAVRVDVIEEVGSAVSPSLGLNKAIVSDVLHLRSQWSYNFTAPTLNDQFWNYGGNRVLKSERAHKADIGFHFRERYGSTSLDWQIQTYITRAKNGIIWQPGENGVWSPINLQQLHGHGIEQSVLLSAYVRDLRFHLGSQATWNRAFIPRARFEGDNAVDKQLRYMPSWMLRVQGGAQYKSASLNVELSHNGKRFSSEDHSSPTDPMPAYTVANVSAQIRTSVSGYEPSLRLSLVNAFNTSYSTIVWYPMPGRHLLVALRVSRKS